MQIEMHIDMHMPPRFDLAAFGAAPHMTLPAPAGRVRIGERTEREDMDMGDETAVRTIREQLGRRSDLVPAVMDTKNARRAAPPGESLLALCLTWRQEAANHHEDQLSMGV